MKQLLHKVKHMLSSEKLPSPQSGIALREHSIGTPNVIDASRQRGYLAGQLLVATPVIDAGCFHKAVVYMFAHTAEGAAGLIINQPLELVHYSALIEGMAVPQDTTSGALPVYFGGPVERSRGFVIHSTDYVRDFTLARGPELAVTASSAIVADIVAGRGPQQAALVAGSAGWAAGQLEAEIEANSWITVPASAALMFGTENDLKWATASKSLGIDMAFFSTTVGHA